MKKLHGLLLACLINTPLAATAKTVEVTGDTLHPDVWTASGFNDTRTRFELGDGWNDGVAHLHVVANYVGDYGYSWFMQVGLSTSENAQFMTTVAEQGCIFDTYYGCSYYPIPDTEHFTTYAPVDLVTPDFSTANSSSSSWSGSVLTFDFSPILESGKDYYLFVRFSSGGWTGDEASYVGTLSQVPVPAAAWLFGSGLLGLAGIGRRTQRA